MKSVFTVVFVAFLMTSAWAQTESGAVDAADAVMSDLTTYPAAEVDLKDFLWTARPVVVFAETAADPAFTLQMRLLADRPEELTERDVVVIVDTDPENPSALRLKLRPRGFMLVLMGKDGTVKLRKPFPWDVRELTRSIDKMPLRREEIRNRPGNP